MAVHLPSDPSLITENWQDNIPGLFPTLEPAIVNGSNFNDGSIIRIRLQILDQLESEIFFPVIEIKDANNQVKNNVTIFREQLNIPGTLFLSGVKPLATPIHIKMMTNLFR